MNDHRIDLVLRTWYPKDHPLHFDLHHPLGKLVGEWGELLDDYMKYLYKPEYEFQPLDELVDIWYYLRILAYQTGVELKQGPIPILGDYGHIKSIDYLISRSIEKANEALRLSIEEGRKAVISIAPYILRYNYCILIETCELCNLTIDQLTKASWQKLGPGSKRGEEWMKARETAITKTS